MKQIERISGMEKLFDFASNAIKQRPLKKEMYQKTKLIIEVLTSYYESEEWKQDFADDEAGRLPKDLKRGILSEDGIWNLLSDWKELNSK